MKKTSMINYKMLSALSVCCITHSDIHTAVCVNLNIYEYSIFIFY